MIIEHIGYGYDYDTEKNILIGKTEISNYGFFSTFTLLLTAIMITYKRFHKLPEDIDGTNLLRNLCRENGYDMYKHFFHINKESVIDLEYNMPVPFTNDDQHTVYEEKYTKYYCEFYKKYFNLNENVVNKINFMKEKYNIDSENTVSIVYRGTDKWTDFGGFNHISPGLYLRLAREIKENNPGIDVLIQSESSSVNRIFRESIGAKEISETLTSKIDGTPIFLYLQENKLEWAEYYVACVMLHSKSKILVTYTGNTSFFLYLNRGTTKNMYQEPTFKTNDNKEFFIHEN
jgi:hypothetical protein